MMRDMIDYLHTVLLCGHVARFTSTIKTQFVSNAEPLSTAFMYLRCTCASEQECFIFSLYVCVLVLCIENEKAKDLQKEQLVRCYILSMTIKESPTTINIFDNQISD